MKNKERKTIFLDVGGVLLTNGWGHESRQRAAERFKIEYSEMNFPHEFIFSIYEIGKISLREYLDTVVFNRPRNFVHEEFIAFMFGESQELPDMLQWLIQWREQTGHRVIAINNEGKELNDYRIQKFGLKNAFDAFVSSCDVGMRKPDPGIFKLALGVAQSKAEDCLYFDDRPMLAQAASKLGIHAHHHKDFESTKKILESL